MLASYSLEKPNSVNMVSIYDESTLVFKSDLLKTSASYDNKPEYTRYLFGANLFKLFTNLSVMFAASFVAYILEISAIKAS
jgi:hypothetical protein